MPFDPAVILVMTTIPWGCTCFHEKPMKLLFIVSDGLSGSIHLNLRSKNILRGASISLDEI